MCTQLQDIGGGGKIVLVEVALEAAVPFGVGSREGEPGEEFGDGAGRGRPVHFAQGFHQILRRHVSPIHFYLD